MEKPAKQREVFRNNKGSYNGQGSKHGGGPSRLRAQTVVLCVFLRKKRMERIKEEISLPWSSSSSLSLSLYIYIYIYI
ncbi:hypothetical protein NC653_003849 [Populus alba x Populus x berolinensis]|uniref:Uncharacterized protein n=1 Tax=Populus alba x Populus x berolinensis TaxID=444605 RepID=A0AAD6RST2_9ROSI|nr:hypothetical protein NC653_003849 [Populus alba x Populus x berolinensis]